MALGKNAQFDIGNLIARPPVVVVLGHVDHGKSSLLEAIRKDFVITAKESGGITQHVGAYEITMPGGRKITFIDTPGHEAFSAMRDRGAKTADIALLVVDASEGVKTQTKEALSFVKKAGIPMIVVFNKIDKPGADPEKVKQELSKEGVVAESWGGKTLTANVSAKTGQGVPDLLETILLVAEMEELKADIQKPAEGTIIESSLDQQKGPRSTLILTNGILKISDFIATRSAFGKVKSLADFGGKSISQALPSQPVIVIGFEAPPGAGEKFNVYPDKEQAQAVVEKKKVSSDLQQAKTQDNGIKILNIILKSDFLGSTEAIESVLKAIPQEKVALRILKSAAGDITADDIKTAETSHAKIFGFRVKIDEQTKNFSQQKGVVVKIFDIIYDLAQEIRRAMANILSPETKRVDLGKFKVTVIFKQGKDNQIVGGKVLEGEITRNVQAEVLRESEVIGKGRIKGLQENKKDIGLAQKGKEAGIMFAGDAVLQENDILQVYREDREKGTL